MEVWHSNYIPSVSLHNRRARKLWLDLLDHGYRITPVFGRDWHRNPTNPEPTAVTYMEAEMADEDSALSAIRGGRTLLSLGPDLIWDLSDGDKSYTAGDIIPEGTYCFAANPDFERRKEAWQGFGIRIDRILLYGAGERILASLPGTGGAVNCVLKGEDRFAHVEAEGVVDGKECTVCLSAPVYLSK